MHGEKKAHRKKHIDLLILIT